MLAGAPIGMPTQLGFPPSPVPLSGPPGIAKLGALPPVSDMMSGIGQQILAAVTTATQASETQVGAELRQVETTFSELALKVNRVEALLNRHGVNASGIQQDSFDKVLAAIDRRWQQEMQSVQRELHQAILAHNHNADLMADHKSAIDTLSSEVDVHEILKQEEPHAVRLSGDELRSHLEEIAKTLQQSGTQDTNALLERGEAVLQRASMLVSAHMASAYQHHEGMPAEMFPPATYGHGAISAGTSPYGAVLPGTFPEYDHHPAGSGMYPCQSPQHQLQAAIDHHQLAAAGHRHAHYALPHGVVL